MIKSWLNMWRNLFDFKGNTSRKEYWLACILNVPVMFIFIVPVGLIIRYFPISPEAMSVIYLILFHIPTVALYFRRANDANWKPLTALYMALVCPVISGFVVGLFPSVSKGEHLFPPFYSIIGKLFALLAGFCLYVGVLSIFI